MLDEVVKIIRSPDSIVVNKNRYGTAAASQSQVKRPLPSVEERFVISASELTVPTARRARRWGAVDLAESAGTRSRRFLVERQQRRWNRAGEIR
jgi:hypothetical protein